MYIVYIYIYYCIVACRCLSLCHVCIKKVKLINHDCLPILVLLYIMLYVVLAYLMLFAALSNAVCFNNVFFSLLLIFANAFCFMLCLGLLTQFVYFKYDFSSCTVLLICLFLLNLCSHHFYM